ncbi:MAG TPA: UrcA family protein [Steroidobacteraceae bacterium]|nr:UrcA family protein [Steroidobacteraceae bacterium]
MTKALIRVAIGLFAVTSVGTVVVADDMGEVTVQASRVVSKVVGRTASGVPIEDVSLSYGVSAKDLDLSTHAGAMELQKRVADAANSACKELSRQYPGSSPSDADCAKASTAKAMVRVNELIAAAAKKPGT